MTTTTLFGIYLAPLYASIAQVESDNGKTSDNVYQLTRVFISDCNRICGGYYDKMQRMWRGGYYDFRDSDRYTCRSICEKAMLIYWSHWGKALEKEVGGITVEVLANIHRYGPIGAFDWHKREESSPYWIKVSEYYNRFKETMKCD